MAVPGIDDIQVTRDGVWGAGGGVDEPSFVHEVFAIAEDAQRMGGLRWSLRNLWQKPVSWMTWCQHLQKRAAQIEGHGVVPWNAKEDLLDELVYQQW